MFSFNTSSVIVYYMKILKEDGFKIQVLAESGQWTYQDICNVFNDLYTINQIKYWINKYCPNKNIKKEYSRGGSKLEHLLKQIFPYDKIISEFPLPDKLRVDFVVDEPYNLAFEFDGIQHSTFSNHFHGGKLEFLESQVRDISKENYLKERGINLIRLNNPEITLGELKDLINQVGYGIRLQPQSKLTIQERTVLHKSKLKSIQQARPKVKVPYKKPQISEEQKLKQKQFRKDQYQKAKEWKKQLKEKMKI